MATWTVRTELGERSYREGEVRSMLTRRDLTGLELARPSTDHSWLPLCDHEAFAAVRPRRAALWAPWLTLGGHVLFWLFGTAAAVGVAGLWGLVALVWTPLLLLHAGWAGWTTWRALSATRTTYRVDVGGAKARGAGDRVQARDPFLDELAQAAAGLEQATEGRDQPVDLSALVSAAEEAHGRRVRLAGAASEAARTRLYEERARVVERLDAAGAGERGVIEAELAALEDRIAQVDALRGQAARLAARERTLLHEIESLRLRLLAEGPSMPVGAELTRLRMELVAEAEVEVVARAGVAEG